MDQDSKETTQEDYPLERVSLNDLQLFMDLDSYETVFAENFYKGLFNWYSDNIRVIREDGKLVGLIYVLAYGIETVESEDDPYGEITSIFVADNLRGKGLGEKLMRFGIERLKERGVPRIQLHTRVDNIPMQKLAEKLGFKVAETVPNFYTSMGKDACRMVLENFSQPDSITQTGNR